jgi:hypothetical protein
MPVQFFVLAFIRTNRIVGYSSNHAYFWLLFYQVVTLNVILSEAKDLVFRIQVPPNPNNEILRRGAVGAERKRSAPQNDNNGDDLL